ncbi:uncharacterized protein B0H64DRAFT_443528 [Chaetomium fimeti]|uniref:Uncharacterized protein n=1 Tax=Chaetomium fimeti TaxID=1854472 RepID=A0AAE0HDU4_9PEZI|nr:hypothetical protein B0H64DRAFT_443528 [Chaetomium fimeti]
MGQEQSRPPAATGNPVAPPEIAAIGLPRRLVASITGSWPHISYSLRDYNSEQHAYELSLANGWRGNMTLHGGPSQYHPPLAHAERAGAMRESFAITLPALPPYEQQQRTEILHCPASWKQPWYWFAMEVGDGQHRRVERFEWRRSRGSEVRSIADQSRWGYGGWKLLRMGDESDDSSGGHGKSGARVDGYSSDQKEVVAVWAHAGTVKSAMSKMGDFEYRGSGATGELGQLWSIMAAMTCMCIWQKGKQKSEEDDDRRRRRR